MRPFRKYGASGPLICRVCGWLIPLEFLGKDVRWTSVAIMLFSLGLYGFLVGRSGQKETGSPHIIALSIVTGFLCWFLLVYDPTFSPWTEEGGVDYWLLPAFRICLVKRELLLIALACSLCFLSRYVLLFWIPVYIVYTFSFLNREKDQSLSLQFLCLLFC